MKKLKIKQTSSTSTHGDNIQEVVNNPAIQALRQLNMPSDKNSLAVSPDDNAMAADNFCSPDSLESKTSPAKYLYDIYTMAESRIDPVNSAKKLDTRRPDLKHMELSDVNLNQEVTTLSLANQVMVEFAKENGSDINDQEALYKKLAEETAPIQNLPYDIHHETVRQGLKIFDGMNLNKLVLSLSRFPFAPEYFDPYLVKNSIDRANLFAKDKQLNDSQKLDRLLHRTGLKRSDLVLLESAASHLFEFPHIVDIVAYYLEWNERFNLPVNQYCALIHKLDTTINEGEKFSFLEQVFGEDDAQWINNALESNNKPLNSLTAEEQTTLKQGLKLTDQEWQLVVTEVTMGFPGNDKLNADTLSALYRLATLFPILGLDVFTGITLAKKLRHDESALKALREKASTHTLSVMDMLVWLQEWLKDSKFTPEQLLIMLTDEQELTFHATSDIQQQLELLYNSIKPNLLNSASFSAYERVKVEKLTTPFTPAENILTVNIDWYSELANRTVIDAIGLVTPNEKDLKATIEAIIDEQVKNADGWKDIEYQILNNPVEEVTNVLEAGIKNTREQLNLSLATHLDGSTDKADQTINWFSDHYTVLSKLLAPFHNENTDIDKGVLALLHTIRRYFFTVQILALEPVEINFIAENSHKIKEGLSHELSLELLFYLTRMKQLCHKQAKASDWVDYFTGNDQNNDQLAQLLNTTQEELKVLIDANITTANIDSVTKADLLARYIHLAEALSMSGTDLLTIVPFANNISLAWDQKKLAAKTIMQAISRLGSQA